MIAGIWNMGHVITILCIIVGLMTVMQLNALLTEE